MPPSHRRSIACALSLSIALLESTLPGAAQAQEWTRFRGPNGTGQSDCVTIPVQWSESDYNWNVELPGIGHSSPVLWGDKIFLIGAFEDTVQRTVVCLNAADGSQLWQRTFDGKPHDKHKFNSFASSTPAVDEDRVYVVWSTPEEYTLMALDHQGRDVWKLNLGPYVSQHSCGTSPIVYKDLVVLGNDQDGVSFLVAVDRLTGKTRWQTNRTSQNVAYSTPCVFTPKGGDDQLIFNSGAHGISSVDPQTGKINWELDVLDKRSVSSPIVAGGLLLGSTGSGNGGHYIAAVRPATGGAAPELAYRVDESAPYVPTLIANGDLLFMWSDKGVVCALEAATGIEVGRVRVGGNFHGSPVCVNNRLYCIAEDGTVCVVAATKTPEVLARNPLGEESRATPAVAGGRMYLRTRSHLFSIGGK